MDTHMACTLYVGQLSKPIHHRGHVCFILLHRDSPQALCTCKPSTSTAKAPQQTDVLGSRTGAEHGPRWICPKRELNSSIQCLQPKFCRVPLKWYSLHTIAIPKHDVVSEGAVNIQIYLFDFRGPALCLLFHLLEGRVADKRKELDTI